MLGVNPEVWDEVLVLPDILFGGGDWCAPRDGLPEREFERERSLLFSLTRRERWKGQMPSSIAAVDTSGAGRVLTAVGEVEGVVVRAAGETVSERNLEMGPADDDEGTMLLGSGREVPAVYRLLGGTDMLDCRFHQTLAIGMIQVNGSGYRRAICDAR